MVMKINNSHIFGVAILLSLFLFNGCEDDELPAKKVQNLVFLDKSESVTNNAKTKEYVDKLKGIVKSEMKGFDDRFTIRFVHGNTVGVNEGFDVPINIPQPKLHGGARTQQEQMDEYNNSIGKLKDKCYEGIDSAFSKLNNTGTEMNTDLWSTLEVISRHYKNTKPEVEKQVIYISDMAESMNGNGRRDFDNVRIASKMEADSLAKVDAVWIKQNLDISEKSLDKVKIRIWTPSDGMGRNNFQNQRYYWESLFNAFGIEDLEYN